MKPIVYALAALAAMLSAAATPVAASPTPAPVHSPNIHLPNVPLHSEVVVEVNKKGQVVRVKSTKPSKVRSFNVQTFGNALQMWIRRRDGTAQVGLYRITYDYDPKTTNVARHVSLISAGGSWANDEGAANVMIGIAHKQAIEMQKAAEEAAKKQQERNAKLPSLNEIRGHPSASPSPKLTLPPQ
ncbi:MAG: hypothetical protein JO078_03265 [Candidatus Eremiobacteraeota bacterium]|nr:hypothetical protein [Candidatus Eremiobacteraeota bacterium]MBV9057200.1 hypothetical protein [Candidatus Eremiobacteraeota bacterium]MBV9699126.1 hypothetical protein [Candidatus Eremiobacteraeota bacterium]